MQPGHQLLAFDVVVHAAPHRSVPARQVVVEQLPVDVLTVTEAELPPFSISFEQAMQQLEALPGMFVEPDGSFVWKSTDAGLSCQLDGNLYDRDDHLLYSTLKGQCTSEVLDQWLASIGWPTQSVVMQDLRRGWFLTDSAFRTIAAR